MSASIDNASIDKPSPSIQPSQARLPKLTVTPVAQTAQVAQKSKKRSSGKKALGKKTLGKITWLSRQIVRDIHRGIFAQTFLVILGVALVPTLGLLIANQRSANLQGQRLEQDFEKAATAAGLQVERWLDTNHFALQQNAALRNVMDVEPAQQEAALKTIVETYDWTYIAFSLELDGYMDARSDGEANPIEKWDGSKAHFRGDRQYFQQVSDGAALGSELLISRTSGLPALCLSVPVKQNFQLSGALVSCSHLDAIARTITNTQVGESGIAILVDGDNRVIAHGGAIRVSEELEDFSKYPALMMNQLETPTRFQWRAREVTAYVKPVGSTAGLEDWKLIIQQDTAEAYQSIDQARRNTLLLLGGTGCLTLLIAYGFSRQLVRPIKSLTTAANQASMGQLDVTVDGIERQDEIGELARSVKRLATSVAIAFEEIEGG